MATYPSDPFLVYKRLGTKDSPFVQYNSPIRVTNGKVYLTEIPNKTNHVTVSDGTTSYAEMTSQASLSANNNYYVDYENGVVYFDPSHNDKLLTFSFLGEGIVSIPASRIYTQSSNGTPTQDLQDMIDNYNQLNGTDLYNLFDPQTGHKHSGAAGDAPPIDSQYVTYDNGLGTVSKVKDTLDSHAAQLADIAINVKVYGAKGDGTTDDTQAIQNAINYAYTIGGNVYFPVGMYYISGTLTVHEGVNLIGASIPNNWSSHFVGTIIEYHGTGIAVTVGNPNDTTANLRLKNLFINDANSTGSVGLKVGLNSGQNGDTATTHTTDIRAENVVVYGFNEGIQINHAFGLTFTMVKTINTRTYGWHFTDQGSYNMTYSTFMNSGAYSAGNSGIAVLIERVMSTSTKFQNFFIDSCLIGIKITSPISNRLLFSNIGIEDILQYGIYISNSQPCTIGMENISISPYAADESNWKDNIYVNIPNGDFYLTNTNIPNSNSPTNGYDLNMVAGTAYLKNVQLQKLNGSYYGDRFYGLNMNRPMPGAYDIIRQTVDVTGTATSYQAVNGWNKNVFIRTSGIGSNGNPISTTFTQAMKGQVINLYGYDDTNKFYLDKYYFPNLTRSLTLGVGDSATLLYDDITNSGTAGWWLIDYKTDRYMSSVPTSGFWEQGRIIYKTNPTLQGTAGSQYIVTGWRKMNTGTGNVLGADWVEMHTLTGS